MRTNIAIIRDHSGSMSSLSRKALSDYNTLLQTLKDSSIGESYLTVVEADGVARVKERTVPLYNSYSLSSYNVNGSTPLYDAVNEAINELSKYDGPGVANLILVITDGQENASRQINGPDLGNKIRGLQATDRWTFTFRVPKGYARYLSSTLGLHEGNIIEWAQTEADLERSTRDTVAGTQSYFTARATGRTSVNTFYANPADVKNLDKSLVDVSNKFKKYTIEPFQDGISIADFCVQKIGKYELGRVYYSLNKPEKVQQNKDLIIRDTKSGAMYGGTQARGLLGLPATGDIKLAPGNMGNYEVFVRSTSNNRKLYANNGVLVKA